MKKWESEDQIHARIRELTDQIRVLRREMKETFGREIRPPIRRASAADRPQQKKSR